MVSLDVLNKLSIDWQFPSGGDPHPMIPERCLNVRTPIREVFHIGLDRRISFAITENEWSKLEISWLDLEDPFQHGRLDLMRLLDRSQSHGSYQKQGSAENDIWSTSI